MLGILLTVTFLSGCTDTKKVDCYICEGSGDCPECGGTGTIDGEPCAACDGTGTCYRCNGEGTIDQEQPE